MKNDIIYSQTTRIVGKRNDIDSFKLGIKRLEDSKFNHANLNFLKYKNYLITIIMKTYLEI